MRRLAPAVIVLAIAYVIYLRWPLGRADLGMPVSLGCLLVLSLDLARRGRANPPGL